MISLGTSNASLLWENGTRVREECQRTNRTGNLRVAHWSVNEDHSSGLLFPETWPGGDRNGAETQKSGMRGMRVSLFLGDPRVEDLKECQKKIRKESSKLGIPWIGVF